MLGHGGIGVNDFSKISKLSKMPKLPGRSVILDRVMFGIFQAYRQAMKGKTLPCTGPTNLQSERLLFLSIIS
jgi:hypothetical protein